MRKTATCSPEEFVQAWQTSENLKEVGRRLKMRGASAASRAGYMRRMGIPLKKFNGAGRPRTLKIKALSDLARSLANGTIK